MRATGVSEWHKYEIERMLNLGETQRNEGRTVLGKGQTRALYANKKQ